MFLCNPGQPARADGVQARQVEARADGARVGRARLQRR